MAVATRNAGYGNPAYYVMNADGSNVSAVTKAPGVYVAPAWVP
jgi:Tol biopolymer transport system component